MGERLERLLDDSSLADSEVGMAVYDLTDDTCVFRYQEKKLFRPASVEKLVTAITALDALGCGHPFTTRLCYAGQMDGTCLDGDLYVVGGFDPEFGEADMDSLVGWVKRAGIRRISGQLCGDLSMKDSLHWGSGWAWDDNPWYFQPYLSPLLYCKDYVEVTVRPVKGKAQPEVLCRPSSSFYAVTNEARTNDPSAGEFEITRDWLRGSNRIIVRGNCTSPRMERLNMQASQDFFMHAFREKLQAAGVEAGDCAFRPCPEDAALLGECSHSLADVLLPMLKKSDNLSAEAVFYHLAASANPRHAGSEDAVEVIEEMIRSLGFDPSRYRIADGCGVSPYNYVSGGLLSPLFAMGKHRAAYKAKQKAYNGAAANYEKTVLTAFKEVHDAIVNFNKIKEIHESRRQLAEASRTAVELAQLQYINGVIGYLDLLDAQRSYFDAQVSLSNAVCDQQIMMINLYKALGGGWK